MMPVKADLAICSSAIGVSAWIVQECGFHVKPLFGFQFLRDCSGFLQIRSQMIFYILFVMVLHILTSHPNLTSHTVILTLDHLKRTLFPVCSASISSRRTCPGSQLLGQGRGSLGHSSLCWPSIN